MDCDDIETGTRHYFLSLLATDGQFITHAELKINILDVDDNDPVFDREYFIISPPFLAGKPIFSFFVTDNDVTPNITFQINQPDDDVMENQELINNNPRSKANMFYVNGSQFKWNFVSNRNIDCDTWVPDYVILTTKNRRRFSRNSQITIVIYCDRKKKEFSRNVIDTESESLCLDEEDISFNTESSYPKMCNCH